MDAVGGKRNRLQSVVSIGVEISSDATEPEVLDRFIEIEGIRISAIRRLGLWDILKNSKRFVGKRRLDVHRWRREEA